MHTHICMHYPNSRKFSPKKIEHHWIFTHSWQSYSVLCLRFLVPFFLAKCRQLYELRIQFLLKAEGQQICFYYGFLKYIHCAESRRSDNVYLLFEMIYDVFPWCKFGAFISFICIFYAHNWRRKTPNSNICNEILFSIAADWFTAYYPTSFVTTHIIEFNLHICCLNRLEANEWASVAVVDISDTILLKGRFFSAKIFHSWKDTSVFSSQNHFYTCIHGMFQKKPYFSLLQNSILVCFTYFAERNLI